MEERKLASSIQDTESKNRYEDLTLSQRKVAKVIQIINFRKEKIKQDSNFIKQIQSRWSGIYESLASIRKLKIDNIYIILLLKVRQKIIKKGNNY